MVDTVVAIENCSYVIVPLSPKQREQRCLTIAGLDSIMSASPLPLPSCNAQSTIGENKTKDVSSASAILPSDWCALSKRSKFDVKFLGGGGDRPPRPPSVYGPAIANQNALCHHHSTLCHHYSTLYHHHSSLAVAASTAAYLRNRSPTSALENMTPHQAWYGRKPGVEHLRVFGSTAYVHISRDSRKKLDSKWWHKDTTKDRELTTMRRSA